MMKVGQKVKYIGEWQPAMTGKKGKVVKIERTGWVYVDFGNKMVRACAILNLEKAK
jgi:hypothetical protein